MQTFIKLNSSIEFSRTFSHEKITGISISILATFENIKNSIIDDVEMCPFN